MVQSALRFVVEPIFERIFHPRSYGFRPERGCKDALREVDRLLKAGYVWVVDADLEDYFGSIPHEPLLREIEQYIGDGRVLGLLEGVLEAGDHGGIGAMDPREGHAARGRDQSSVGQPLSELGGWSHGGSRISNGALRG